MKNLKILFIAVLTVVAVNLGQAQTKIAHISSEELIEAMPAFKSAQSQINDLQNNYRAQIEDMLKELEEKRVRFEADARNLSDEQNQKNLEDFQQSQDRIRNFQMNAEENLSKKQADLYKPIMESAQAAIQRVAKKLGYDYVLDSTQGGGVIVADGHDLLPDVKKELGI